MSARWSWHGTRRAAHAAAIVVVIASMFAACEPKPEVSPELPRRENARPRYRIAWSTRLGGPGFDQLREVVVLKDGSLLVAGQASSEGFPVARDAVQPRYGGEPSGRGHEGLVGGDAYVARVDAASGRVLAGTYFGGSKQERNVYGLAVASDGGVLITTATRSPDARTTKGVAQPRYGGGQADWLIAKLSGDLRRIVWCTYLGGPGEDFPRGGLLLAPDGGVIVLGVGEEGFPTTRGAYGAPGKGRRDVYVARLREDGGAVEYCARIGGSGEDGTPGGAIAPDGSVVVGGSTDSADFPVTEGASGRRLAGKSDFFLARLSADGAALAASTLLGSSESDYIEHRVHVTPDRAVWCAGAGGAADFAGGKAKLLGPGGGDDGVLARLDGDLRALELAVRIGGSGGENLLMPTIGPDGNLWFCGFSSSRDFPATEDSLQTYGGGPNDGVLGAMTPDGSRLVFATLIGGGGDEVVRSYAFGPDGAVYLVGGTTAADFPVTDGSKAQGRFDAFVMKLVPAMEGGAASRR